jgi:TP901 family phage tail tape measure protein
MFGGGDLGMGIGFYLKDGFSGPAASIGGGLDSLEGKVNGLAGKTFMINQFNEALERVGGVLDAIIAPGEKFDKKLHDLSAITGLTGGALDSIGGKARDLAKDFGGAASEQVDGFKMILSRLGPELAKNDEALAKMGENTMLLSKTMNGDAVGATDALTTAMLQYNVSLDDPLQASAEMTAMMNDMAKAAQVGSAEVPQIAQTLKVAGLSAKNAGVDFAELNATIQVLGKGTLYGAEAGTQLRNVLGKLGEGEYLPEKSLKILEKYGVNLGVLTDTTIPLTARLQELSKVSGDSAAISEIFGVENQRAAMLLLQNIPLIEQWGSAIKEDVNSGTEQAGVVMGSFSEKMSRVKARLEDVAIGIFETTKNMLPFVQTSLMMVQGVMALVPAFTSMQALWASFRASAIMTTFATQGLSAGFAAMGTAIWTALAPLLPIIAAIALLVGIVWAVKKGMDLFNESMENGTAPLTGFWGFLQRIGGVVSAIIEIFQTWNGTTWEMSDKMKAALERMGILEYVLNLSTWIVRIIEFFKGMGEVFSSVWEQIKSIFSAVGDTVSSVFDKMGITFGKTTSDLETWKKAGRALAAIIVGVLLYAVVSLTISMISLAISVIAATWPILLIIAAIIAVIYVFTHWGEISEWLAEKFSELWDWITNIASAVWDWASSMGEAALEMGATFVDNIVDGILGAWDFLKTTLIGLFNSLIDFLPFGRQILNILTGQEITAGTGLSISEGAGGGRSAAITNQIAENYAASATAPPTIFDKSTTKTENIANNVYLDGTLIYENVNNRSQFEDARH